MDRRSPPEPDTADDVDLDEQPWERQPGEPSRAHAAFRLYRDLSVTQRDIARVAQEVNISGRRAREWAVEWDWRDRAEAWDEACHRIEDAERLEAIRSMHALHRQAGRAAIVKAVQALSAIDADDMTVHAAARLLELGAKLERSTLVVSVEELQGVYVEDADVDDPWERIAQELEQPERDPDRLDA